MRKTQVPLFSSKWDSSFKQLQLSAAPIQEELQQKAASGRGAPNVAGRGWGVTAREGPPPEGLPGKKSRKLGCWGKPEGQGGTARSNWLGLELFQ